MWGNVSKNLMAASAALIASPALAWQSSEHCPRSPRQHRAQDATAGPAHGRRARASDPGAAGPQSPHERPKTASASPRRSATSPSRAKDHNLELYGFVQLDAIQDFKRVNPDWDATLRPSRIPTEEWRSRRRPVDLQRPPVAVGREGDRNPLGQALRGEVRVRPLRDGVDAGQTTFRVRHMYAKWGPFLAGQTNTLVHGRRHLPQRARLLGPNRHGVRPQSADPLDPQSATGTAGGVRSRSSIRATTSIPGNIRLIDQDIAANLQANEELPDLTAAVRYGGDWGHVRLAGILRKIGYETRGTDDNEPSGQDTGWGVNATTAIKLGMATPRLGVVYGRGIATYMNDGGMDLAPAVSTILQPPSLILVPRGRGREAARRVSLRRPAVGEAVELGHRLQLHEGGQHELPGRRPPSTRANMRRRTCFGRRRTTSWPARNSCGASAPTTTATREPTFASRRVSNGPSRARTSGKFSTRLAGAPPGEGCGRWRPESTPRCPRRSFRPRISQGNWTTLPPPRRHRRCA